MAQFGRWLLTGCMHVEWFESRCRFQVFKSMLWACIWLLYMQFAIEVIPQLSWLICANSALQGVTMNIQAWDARAFGHMQYQHQAFQSELDPSYNPFKFASDRAWINWIAPVEATPRPELFLFGNLDCVMSSHRHRFPHLMSYLRPDEVCISIALLAWLDIPGFEAIPHVLPYT